MVAAGVELPCKCICCPGGRTTLYVGVDTHRVNSYLTVVDSAGDLVRRRQVRAGRADQRAGNRQVPQRDSRHHSLRRRQKAGCSLRLGACPPDSPELLEGLSNIDFFKL